MSNSEAGTTSDAIRESEGVYQVFLNFRGPDTRHGFTDFLYHDLVDAGVRVFRDDEELHVGEVIGENLLHAINNSIIYIPIFSQTYASSKWCLRELAHIVDNVSKSKDKKCILPIFFNVEPDLVKLKDPVYSNDLLEHEKQFPDEVKAWRAALLKVGKIKGWNVKLSQAEIVKSVVEKVLEKLEIKQKSVTKNVVGLDDRVKDLTELLDINHRDMRLIAIYGMGGIGKTTVAKVIFNQLSSHFGKCSSFLEDVRESSSTNEGIVRLQRKLLSDIAGSRSAEQVKNNEQGIRRIREVLRTKKVLVVLDDVAEEQHIENLIGNYSLRLGSRILITTRDKTIPSDEGFNGEIRRYEMLKMDVALALQLFSRHAFGKDIPPYDYRGLSSEIVSSTGGLPLAIEVIGSSLKRRDKAIWEETLIGLKNLPEEKILKKLKISYDGLDKNQKQIFLDIACFFFNKKKIDAIYMWTNCQFQPKRGIEVLKERCLIKILDNGKFWMHDQLIDMGRQIVREESQDNLEKQSRLWIAEDALQIIRTEERKNKVQALQVSRVDEGGCIKITNKEFEKLPNLRFLDLNDGTYVGDFARCRSNLRWLSWQFPLEDDFRADNLYLDRLIVCKLQYIAFKDDSKAWDLIKRARNLKFLLFSCCSGITTIPDISKCSGLEILTLEGCSNLKKIESFIGNLQSLIELKIEMCENLTDLPKEIGALGKLKHFSLSRCKKLRELPDSIGNLTSLMELDLSETTIRKLPNSLGKLKSLRILRSIIHPLKFWEYHAWQLPSDISTLVNLEELDLSWHNVTGEIPIEIGELSSLRILNLKFTGICGIPRTINMLNHLQTLNLEGCDEIQELPELPTSLTFLHLKSKSLLSVPDLSNLTNLVELQLSNYKFSREKSKSLGGCNLRWIERLSRLKKLELDLLDVPASPELTSLSHLEELVLKHIDLKPLMQLPSSNWSLRNLLTLEITCCEVEDIPLGGLPRLEKLHVESCVPLQSLFIPLELRKLRQVDVSFCPELVEIRAVGLSKSLEHLAVDQCRSLTRISGLSYLKNLVFFSINECSVLTNVEGLDELESLISLKVWCCKSLRRLIDAYCTKIPDDCSITIKRCGESIKDSVKDPSPLFPISLYGMSLKRYIEEIRQNTSNKINHTVAIIFVLGVTKYSEGFGFVGGIEREIEKVTPSSVTYEGLIADVKRFGFHLERMWYKAPGEDCVFLIEIKSDKQVNEMVPLASKRGFVHLYFEGGFESEPSNAEFSEATAIRRQMRDGRTKHDGSVDGGKMASMENRKDNDIIGEPANQNDILWSSRQRGDGGEHYQRSCKATTQVEDQRGLSSNEGGERAIARRTSKESCQKEKEGAEFDISGPDEVSNFPFVGEREIDDTSFINDFQSEPGNAKWFEATASIAEKYLDSGQKQVDLKGEHRDEESAGDVTISTIPSDFPVADRYSEASIVSEVSRWSAEVDELERLLNANL